MWSNSSVFPCLFLLDTFEEHKSATWLNDPQFVVGLYFLEITLRSYILGRNNTDSVLCSSQWIILGLSYAICPAVQDLDFTMWLRWLIINYFIIIN